jgi:hypothetical protein
LESAVTQQDYSLDKSRAFPYILSMDSNYFFFKGFPAEAVDRMAFRMSCLMLASNFRVGTCFNSFFLPSSIGGSL